MKHKNPQLRKKYTRPPMRHERTKYKQATPVHFNNKDSGTMFFTIIFIVIVGGVILLCHLANKYNHTPDKDNNAYTNQHDTRELKPSNNGPGPQNPINVEESDTDDKFDTRQLYLLNADREFINDRGLPLSYTQSDKILSNILKQNQTDPILSKYIEKLRENIEEINHNKNTIQDITDDPDVSINSKETFSDIWRCYFESIYDSVTFFLNFLDMLKENYKYYNEANNYMDIIRRFAYKEVVQSKSNIFYFINGNFPTLFKDIALDKVVRDQTKRINKRYRELLNEFKDFNNINEAEFKNETEYYELMLKGIFWMNIFPVVISSFKLGGELKIIGITKIWPNYEKLIKETSTMKTMLGIRNIVTHMENILKDIKNIVKKKNPIMNIEDISKVIFEIKNLVNNEQNER
eukprot:GAHX01002071.1.p1 GENE.GAHX01002071.1~~GAHX01002071.1.p1  ORF type:complete len:406 (-),score=68.79 GAHX01002071.1:155-1372(-)